MSELISGKEAVQSFINGEQVEFLDKTGQWRTMLDNTILKVFLDHTKFRLKPRTITINGIEVPAPEKNDDPDLELLEHDQDYWLVDLANYPDFVIPHKWKGDPPEYAWADRGLIHLSKDAALLHAKALILASGGTA